MVIDARTCQPRLLYHYLKYIGVEDEELNRIFDNDGDFYQYLVDNIENINDRDDAKDVFVSWINGNGYMDEEKSPIRDLFKRTNGYLKYFKDGDYKGVCRLLQHKESKIFIDDILNEIPLDFVLTVHDSIIVKKEDADKAMRWCQQRHRDIKFELQEIIRK
jgi:hypothetical protein